MNAGFARQKLYEALAYFTENVKHAGLIKLLKLVYYLDLVHLRRAGRTVTSLQYNAWPFGPVPEALYAEVNDPTSDLHKHFEITKARKQLSEDFTPTIDTPEDSIGVSPTAQRYLPGGLKPRVPFKLYYLTKREFEIAQQLAEIFRDASAADMSDVAHQKFGPWKKALFRGKKEGVERPAIDLLEGIVACCDHKRELPIDQLREIIAEREDNRRALG